MFDEVENAFYDACVSLRKNIEAAVDSALDGLSPEEYRIYARIGFLSAMEFAEERKNMDDKLITEE